MTVTDEMLMSRVARGDETAFEILMSRYEDRIYGFTIRMLRDADEARDAFQETFLRVYRKADTFHPDRSFVTWLFTVARNVCLDRIKARKRKAPEVSVEAMQESGLDPATEINGEVGTPIENPHESAAARELEEAVRSAIMKLPEGQRDVMLLKEFENLTYQEIADVLQCSVGTVKSRFHYAFLTLKDMLAPLADGTREAP